MKPFCSRSPHVLLTARIAGTTNPAYSVVAILFSDGLLPPSIDPLRSDFTSTIPAASVSSVFLTTLEQFMD